MGQAKYPEITAALATEQAGPSGLGGVPVISGRRTPRMGAFDSGGTDGRDGRGGSQGANTPVPSQTRGGLRVYKIVVLGDGGVGKSGEYITI